MEPFSPFDSEYRCNTFDSLPRADVAPRHGRRLNWWLIGGLTVAVVLVIAGVEIASDWLHSGVRTS